MQASDASKPPFNGGLYHIKWAYAHKPDEVAGDFYIIGSQHNFPFIYLPEVYQRMILKAEFLFLELNQHDLESDYLGVEFGEKWVSKESSGWLQSLTENEKSLLRQNTSLLETGDCGDDKHFKTKFTLIFYFLSGRQY